MCGHKEELVCYVYCLYGSVHMILLFSIITVAMNVDV